ncbi:MAG: hypothetical protein R2816_07655 [Flavobacteriaceae bacterium]|nr:hypothetical protein [Flavobacteriaceae bacterium]
MSNTNKPGIAFWIIGIIALLWNGMGVYNYLIQAYQTEAYTSSITEDQMAFMESLPSWNTALFALAVFSGLIGTILMLMRKKSAVSLFILSFVTATIGQIYWLFGTNAVEVFSESMPYVMPIIIIVFCLFLVWYSRNQKAKGVLS